MLILLIGLKFFFVWGYNILFFNICLVYYCNLFVLCLVYNYDITILYFIDIGVKFSFM